MLPEDMHLKEQQSQQCNWDGPVYEWECLKIEERNGGQDAFFSRLPFMSYGKANHQLDILFWS